MSPFEESFYICELELQSELAKGEYRAIGRMLSMLRTLRPDDGPQYKWTFNDVFGRVHSFLTHASNISKMFWPMVSSDAPKKPQKLAIWQRTTNRGQHLRSLYNIEATSPLASRDLRNHLEHFDERLDAFFAEISTPGVSPVIIGDMNLGPMSAYSGPTEFKLRNFDPDIQDFHFRGELFNLRVIADEVRKVHQQSWTLNRK
ncbi:hypothetical protein [Hymenobacter bucti]|uniref:Endonuclease/exonuclease/phosphatase domain-containing protein n=1 Tax=Hymenobacter bucti TaxID=1844114 RepID=A0ABW4QYS2_9BACT